MSTRAEESTISRVLRPRSPRSWRWLLLLPIAATLALLTSLAFVEKRTEAEISLTTSSVSFVVGEKTELLSSVTAENLSLQGFGALDLGPGRLAVATSVDGRSAEPGGWTRIDDEGPTRIDASDDFATLTFEDVLLDRLTIEPGSTVALGWDVDDPNVVYLDLGAGAAGRAVIGETQRLACDYCVLDRLPEIYDVDPKYLRFTARRRRPITFSGRDGLTLTLEVPPGTELADHGLTVASDLKFLRLEDGVLHSTLIGDGGRITFEELDGRALAVDAHDFIQLDDFDFLRVKRLAIDDGIRIVLHGRPGVLATGPRDFVKNRLPTLLDWVAARESWLLYLNGVVVALTSILAAVKRILFGRRR